MVFAIFHPKKEAKMTKITMYYDHDCPICRTEAYHMRDNHADKIQIVSVNEGLAELEKFDISRIEAMTYLCVQDTNGTMHKGIEAVRLLHQTAETKFAIILSLPIIKSLANWIYPIFARNRYYLPNWLTKLLFGTVAEDNACDNTCNSGVCKLPSDKR